MTGRWSPLAATWRGGRRRLALHLSLATILAWACTPSRSSGPILAPSPTASPAHAAELRIGLIGTLGRQNVWALFNGEGYSYNDYAVRARYWPRLYELSSPNQDFEPRLAAGMPTPMHPEGAFHTATVPIRTDLLWSDGTAFTAQDAAFTINTALEFDLGFDWADFYDARTLDHAEADSPDALALFFKTQPGVETFQLGALQGPVVQAAFWAPKLEGAAALLPTAESYARIQALQEKTATLQATVNRLYAALLTAQGEQARELQADLRRQQGNLDEATNDLAKEQSGIQAALKAAREPSSTPLTPMNHCWDHGSQTRTRCPRPTRRIATTPRTRARGRILIGPLTGCTPPRKPQSRLWRPMPSTSSWIPRPDRRRRPQRR